MENEGAGISAKVHECSITESKCMEMDEMPNKEFKTNPKISITSKITQ